MGNTSSYNLKTTPPINSQSKIPSIDVNIRGLAEYLEQQSQLEGRLAGITAKAITLVLCNNNASLGSCLFREFLRLSQDGSTADNKANNAANGTVCNGTTNKDTSTRQSRISVEMFVVGSNYLIGLITDHDQLKFFSKGFSTCGALLRRQEAMELVEASYQLAHLHAPAICPRAASAIVHAVMHNKESVGLGYFSKWCLQHCPRLVYWMHRHLAHSISSANARDRLIAAQSKSPATTPSPPTTPLSSTYMSSGITLSQSTAVSSGTVQSTGTTLSYVETPSGSLLQHEVVSNTASCVASADLAAPVIDSHNAATATSATTQSSGTVTIATRVASFSAPLEDKVNSIKRTASANLGNLLRRKSNSSTGSNNADVVDGVDQQVVLKEVHVDLTDTVPHAPIVPHVNLHTSDHKEDQKDEADDDTPILEGADTTASVLTPSLVWLLTASLPLLYTRPPSSSKHDGGPPAGAAGGAAGVGVGAGVSSSGAQQQGRRVSLPRTTLINMLSNNKCPPNHWEPLYLSDRDGLGMNRFQHHVLNYRGPTITIMRTSGDEAVFCLAVDEEWKDSKHFWGGADTRFMQLWPHYKILEHGEKLVYFNTCWRGFPYGIQVGKDYESRALSISGELNTLEHHNIPYTLAAVEVWGCGAAKIRVQQQEYKKRATQDVEKRRQVKLSADDWLDHPDRYLLELANVGSNVAQYAKDAREGH